jgi:flagellar biosynthesis/type III secretory pathway M-ring protein FliF/YscJ
MTLLAAPALPLHTAGKYVAGAYIVFVVMLVIYLGIMALRTSRTRRELSALRQELSERQAREGHGGASPTARHSDHHTEPEREVAR